ncbi:OsmC family peroxiredoxin [Sphingomonas sp. UYP23]
MKSTGRATWQGTWKEGRGMLSTGTSTLPAAPYSFSSRFEGTAGGSPEELLAVAEAGCFNQALANNFGMIGREAESIDTAVEIELLITDGHPTITTLHIIVKAKAAGVTQEEFEKCAERARTNCTIAKLLNRELTMEAVLLPS